MTAHAGTPRFQKPQATVPALPALVKVPAESMRPLPDAPRMFHVEGNCFNPVH
jgi:hypothetical protein